MAYLNCGRCGLEIKIQAANSRIANCPRCLARNATVAPMALSANVITHAAGWGQHHPDHDGDPPELGKPFVGVTGRMNQRR